MAMQPFHAAPANVRRRRPRQEAAAIGVEEDVGSVERLGRLNTSVHAVGEPVGVDVEVADVVVDRGCRGEVSITQSSPSLKRLGTFLADVGGEGRDRSS